MLSRLPDSARVFGIHKVVTGCNMLVCSWILGTHFAGLETQDPSLRITAQDALQHEWFQLDAGRRVCVPAPHANGFTTAYNRMMLVVLSKTVAPKAIGKIPPHKISKHELTSLDPWQFLHHSGNVPS